jgi:phosphoglucosamine mutase
VTRLFGTDGIRGIANVDLTAELALRVGRAAVRALSPSGAARPRFLIGRDTRASGELLEGALAAGITSAGGDVSLVGVLPTPAVAHLAVELGAEAGAVISASHNPAEYNGIKFFSADGYKLPDAVEDEVERLVSDDDGPRPSGADIGRVTADPAALERYEAFVMGACGSLSGLRLVVDCANGAAFRVGPEVLRRLGAEVVPIHDRPDGLNINDGCGATHPEVMAKAVLEERADAGVAFDGDADRAMFADSGGNVIDGDQVLAACALVLKERSHLAGDVVVTTVMANLGFRRCMEDAGIRVVETKVGDRYVLEAMLESGALLGGEQSGHVIFREDSTTGDGLLTAAKFLSMAMERGSTVAALAAAMRKYPQVLQNVRVRDVHALEGAARVWDAVRRVEEELGASGRILVRASGTEPLVRVMVEAETEELALQHANAVAEVVASTLG